VPAPETTPPPVVDKTEETPPTQASGTSRERPRIPASRRLTKRGRLWLFLGIAVVLLVGGFFLWRYFGSYESTDDAQVDVHIYPVSARISGYVIAVNVGDNQYVEKGYVLVEIDPRDYQVAADKAKADLTSAEATARSLNINVPITSVNTLSQLSFSGSGVEDAVAGLAAAEKQLSAAQDQVTEAEANDVKVQDDLVRYKQLVEKQDVSAQIYDQALAAAKASTATVSATHANEAAAGQAVQQARSRVAEAQARRSRSG
jgi:membrane fusion protein (multidrug efflux system)